jgi:hypothetical protein
MSNNIKLFSEFGSGRIDDDAGILHGVSLIQQGEARGHGVQVDQTTLSEVLKACGRFKSGVKVKLTHGGNAGDIVGIIKNARMNDEGNKVVGDMHLMATHPKRNYLLELARTAPDTFGLSISFEKNPPLITEKGIFVRCKRLRSADIEADPAANEDGLFSEEVDIAENSMELSELKAIADKNAEDISAFSTRLAELEEFTIQLKSAMDAKTVANGDGDEDEDDGKDKKDEDEEDEKLSAGNDKLVELASKIDALNEAIKLGAAIGGKNPAAGAEGSLPTEDSKKPQTFSEIVDSLVSSGKSRTDATDFAVKNHPNEHKAHLISLGCFNS